MTAPPIAVAERVRGEVAANTSANEQLGGAKGLLDVTSASLQNVSDTLQKLQSVTVKLADGTITAEQRTQYQAQAGELTKNVQSFINDANYNGNNVLKDPTTLANKVVRNGAGDTYTFSGYKALTNIFNTVSAANTWTRGDASSALTKTGAVGKAITNTLTQLNNFGSYSNYVDTQVELQQGEDRRAADRHRRADRCRPRQGIGEAAVPADPPAARHPGAEHRQPGAADPAEPVPLTRRASLRHVP